LKVKYGITDKKYKTLLKKQKGGCGVCGIKNNIFRGKKVHWCVDHDHNTGAVRGLLCGACNRGIGLLGDSTVVIQKALDYLERCST
jgi:hypothetical protein